MKRSSRGIGIPVGIEVVNRQRLARIDRGQVAAVAAGTLEAIGRAGFDVTVAVVRDRRMRELNRTFRGNDRTTDVLSFPLEDGQVEASCERSEGAYLGDVVIAIETALEQARRFKHSLERELNELVIHGILHLCGYDHEKDDGEMNRIEARLRRKLLD